MRRSAEGRAAAAEVLERHGSRLPPSARPGAPRRAVRGTSKRASSKRVARRADA